MWKGGPALLTNQPPLWKPRLTESTDARLPNGCKHSSCYRSRPGKPRERIGEAFVISCQPWQSSEVQSEQDASHLTPDIVTWNTMLTAWAKGSEWQRALFVFAALLLSVGLRRGDTSARFGTQCTVLLCRQRCNRLRYWKPGSSRIRTSSPTTQSSMPAPRGLAGNRLSQFSQSWRRKSD